MKLAAVITLLIPITRGVPFQECLEEVRSGKWGLTGGFDNYGNPASDISTATAISYGLCKRACGTAPQPFKWPIFAPQFSAWLLPSLALVSGLPFGANNFWANCISVFLAVGSPALAAFSLALTVLNRRWVALRFRSYGYPNAHSAVQFLNSLQQSPLRVTAGSLLENQVIFPGKYCDRWWGQLAAQLNRTHTWSLAAATSIIWVLVAYILTVVGSFKIDLHTTRDSHGQAIGSLWLWLLAIVVGWLLFSPKYDPIQLQEELLHNGILAYALLTPNDDLIPVLGPPSPYAIAFSFPSGRNRMSHDIDQWCTAPIYNYARFLPWMQDIEGICRHYDTALSRTQRSNIPWRYLVASVFALLLQWGTTGAAVVVNWYTPTTGLGCHSGSSLIYGGVGTLVWIMLLLSSYLSHYSASRNNPATTRIARLSIHLRWLGKFLATLNSIWIVSLCLFQLTNFFDRCWCDGGVIQQKRDLYVVIELLQEDIAGMRRGWEAGVSLAVGSTSLYVLFIIFSMYFY